MGTICCKITAINREVNSMTTLSMSSDDRKIIIGNKKMNKNDSFALKYDNLSRRVYDEFFLMESFHWIKCKFLVRIISSFQWTSWTTAIQTQLIDGIVFEARTSNTLWKGGKNVKEFHRSFVFPYDIISQWEESEDASWRNVSE